MEKDRKDMTHSEINILNRKIRKEKQKSFRVTASNIIADKTMERDICKAIKRYLLTQKVFWQRIECTAKIVQGPVGPSFAKSEQIGFPDFLVIKEGVFYGIEVKKADGSALTAKQAQTIMEIKEAGAQGCVVTSAKGVENVLSGQEPSRYVHTTWGAIPIFD